MRRVHGGGTLGVMACWAAVACGPSQAEIASQQKAAAEARAKADAAAKAEAAVAKAEAEAKAAVTAARDAAREPPPRCKDGMVGVPAGTFTMGDAKNNGKAGQVTVAAFCMDRTEVTVAAYSACVKSGTCTPADGPSEERPSCNAGVVEREQHPINCVDWYQAKAYCEAQGQRLPTEEEWEYAARGTDGHLYPWGNAAPSNQLCWDGEGNDLGKGNRKGTCAVGSYPAGRSPFGLDDMSGNVLQWTATAVGADRVIRGGGWSFVVASRVRSAHRYGGGPAGRDGLLGFRCAGSPLP